MTRLSMMLLAATLSMAGAAGGETLSNEAFVTEATQAGLAEVQVGLTRAANDAALDPQLREFARKTLPKLEHHQADARTLNETVSAAGDEPAPASIE